MATKPVAGFFDGVEGKSSKRLQSFLGLVAALIYPLVAGLLKLNGSTVAICSAFLAYSAAMQGVSMYQEAKLLSRGKK